MELNALTILEAHQWLKEKKISAMELVQACLRQIDKEDKKINSFITVLEEEAIEQARKIDSKIKRGEIKNYLTGIPLAIKDNILIKDVRCTAGSKILENYQANYDATVIKRLREVGAIFLGKTNLDEFAMGSSGETSYFGPTKNPYDLERVPGGSSSGSAAAVAAKMCLGALGSDTGGSIRQPASFCGLAGLKPTYGRVSRYGLIAMASSLDQIGPLAKNVDDLAIILSAIEGKDSFDSTTVELDFKVDLPKIIDLKNIKIGISKEFFGKGLDKNIKEIIEFQIRKIEKEGAEVIEVNLPHIEYALSCYYIIMPAEVSANLARYDGLRYGFSYQGKNLLDSYLETRSQGFGNEVKRRIMLGTYTLSAGYYEAYYLKAQKVRTLIKQDFERVFKEVDCLITPATPTIAFKLGEKIDNPLKMYLSDIYTVSVNLAGLPAISMPVGSANNLPVGLQIVGNYFEENKLLSVAKTIEEILTD
ncbi:MAG: Asp-tRNA(Asn)/Glu-tRNA(Gln) amidotransferase subunit GatA [Patescibacteria group bacterium]